jgi:hypothetical protein
MRERERERGTARQAGRDRNKEGTWVGGRERDSSLTLPAYGNKKDLFSIFKQKIDARVKTFQPLRLEKSNKTYASVFKPKRTVRTSGQPRDGSGQFQEQKSFLLLPKNRNMFQALISNLNRGIIYSDRFHKYSNFIRANGLIVGILSRRSGFNPRPGHEEFVVGNFALG